MSAARFVALSIAAALLPTAAVAQTPTLAFADDATVRLSAGATQGDTRIHLKAENLKAVVDDDKKQPCKIETPPEDIGGSGPSSAKVAFGAPVPVEQGATTCLWLVTAAVTGLPPHTTQKRFARVKLGDLEQVIGYTLTDIAPASFTWTVAAPLNPWLVWHGLATDRTLLPITVTTTDGTATGLRLAQGGLRDNPIASEVALEDLDLCGSETCQEKIAAIPPRTVRTLYLRVRPSRPWVHGKYSGSVSFAVNERNDLQMVNLTLHASSWRAWLYGLVLLGLGTWLGFFTNVWARARVLRMEALQAVEGLRVPIAVLAEALRAAPDGHDPVQIRDALARAETAISSAELDRQKLLPPRIPDPYGSPDKSAELKVYLDAVVAHIDGLSHVVRKGLQKLWPHLKAGSSTRAAALEAVHDLDERGANVATEAAATTLVTEVLAKFAKDTGTEADFGRRGEPDGERRTLAWEIAGIHTKVWLIWGLVTVLSGATAFIVSNPGFGTVTDLLLCFLWGVGLPAAVDKLQQLKPTAIATHLSLTLPKAPPSGG